ncbi:CBS domain-containing protein [Streptomyces telluris]|uniref:CBS domain-containing protein n=1 Tax=Streptomyces telluris TaxID=2720021 RepID=A0A9X2LFS6_9ACTN|nr:CBS domain-containing protein [Streptomyces telluris]MCQ8770526.1 CBS domain-containing protein [Streptomyces telluris]NJP81913.1 CBS domain-containing protein [Streptomyces telluris]
MHGTQRTVSDVMTQTVVAVSRGAPYKEIARTLAEWKVSAVPVLAGEGRVIGVVSEADLLPKEQYKDRGPADVAGPDQLSDLAKAAARTAADLMSTPAVTVHADATVAEAARIMARKGVKRLPVIDAEGKLTGIVSRADLLKVYLRSDEDIAQEVRDEVVARLFPHQPPTVEVQVGEGVVTLSGHLPDATLLPLVARLVRAVEGVVNVDLRLDGPTG